MVVMLDQKFVLKMIRKKSVVLGVELMDGEEMVLVKDVDIK